MKHLKKIVALATFAAMLATSVAHASPNDGYRTGRRAPGLAPAVALGTVGVIALIAVLLQHTGGNSNHAHSSGS